MGEETTYRGKPRLEPPTTTAVREQLRNILRSPSFGRSAQMAKLLEFLVGETLNGNSENLKGYVIAVDVLGRRESFDPKLSTIVRSEARRLREKLAAYYQDEGEHDAIEIKLPKGSYVPRFEYRGAVELTQETAKIFAGYRILEELDSEGLGKVYKAEDPRLHRTVVLKMLPASSGGGNNDEEHAEALAAELDHPNVCTVYETGVFAGQSYIVSAFIVGENLALKLERGRIELRTLLEIGIEIAEGLVAAHGRGIVHCDLKPANIVIANDGPTMARVKIIDFGISRKKHPTEQVEPTEPFGTLAYMSPEQLQGERLDGRTDLRSLGVVLYEALTGWLPFHGENAPSLRMAILHGELRFPDDPELEVDPEMERILRKCLEKAPGDRWQSADSLLADLRALSITTTRVQPVRQDRPGWYAPAGIVTALVAVLLTWIAVSPTPNEAPGAEMSIVSLTTDTGREDNPDFSPDGTEVAFDGNVEDENNTDIYVRTIGSTGLRRITTNPARDTAPKWSPDGRSIAFLRWGSHSEKPDLMLMSAIGGPERKIAEIGPFSELIYPPYFDWAPDGIHLVVVDGTSTDDPYSLSLITTTGDERRRLTSPPPGGQLTGDSGPSFSLDGRFLAFARGEQAFVTDIYLLELGTDLMPVGEPKPLNLSGNHFRLAPVWTADGKDVIFRDEQRGGGEEGGLWRLPSDGSEEPKRLVIAGGSPGTPAIDPVGGRLAFPQYTSTSGQDIWLVKLSEAATASDAGAPFIASSRHERAPQYSPDGRRIAFMSIRSGLASIWVCDADGKNAVALFVPDRGQSGTPRWSPDGQIISFDSNHEGQWDVYLIRADGGTPIALTRDSADDYIASWSRDGEWVYFSSTRSGRHEIWKTSADGSETVQVTRNGGGVSFESMDGKYLYYTKTPALIPSLWSIPVDGGEEQKVLDEIW